MRGHVALALAAGRARALINPLAPLLPPKPPRECSELRGAAHRSAMYQGHEQNLQQHLFQQQQQQQQQQSSMQQQQQQQVHTTRDFCAAPPCALLSQCA